MKATLTGKENTELPFVCTLHANRLSAMEVTFKYKCERASFSLHTVWFFPPLNF